LSVFIETAERVQNLSRRKNLRGFEADPYISRGGGRIPKSVSVRAWWRAISSVVDVVKVTKISFIADLVVDGIDIGSERLGEAGAERNVSRFSCPSPRR
jgi:hypothetical protein